MQRKNCNITYTYTDIFLRVVKAGFSLYFFFPYVSSPMCLIKVVEPGRIDFVENNNRIFDLSSN